MSSGQNRCLLDLPHEILFEIFSGLSKSKLIYISRLSSKFKDLAGDKRLWKDVNIKYKDRFHESNEGPGHRRFAFEELYSEPWPVDVVDLSFTEIKPPVFSKSDQLVKVTKLDLSHIKANKVTMEAILAKYQCTELHLGYNTIDFQNRIMGIAPETFSKQTTLEVLSLCGMMCEGSGIIGRRYDLWLAPVLSNCKNLKALHLACMDWRLTGHNMLGFVKQLPTSLVKLCLPEGLSAACSKNFFNSLAKSTPNLKELQLCPERVKHPALLKLQFLETLQLNPCHSLRFSKFCTSVKKFPALKTVCVDIDDVDSFPEVDFLKLRTELESHGITVKIMGEAGYSRYRYPRRYPEDHGNLWRVS